MNVPKTRHKHAAGLIYGPEGQHLDHVAVICCLMEIPLIVTDLDIFDLARKYYPHLEVVHLEYVHVAMQVVQDFDLIFSALPRPLIEDIFFFAERFCHKQIQSIWCPHGNSDKGYLAPFMEGLSKETVALVYGNKMIDFLKDKGSFAQLKAHVLLSNFRYTFYKREKAFYEALVSREILDKLPPDQKVVLYAPTWEDSEKSSSFFRACPELIERLPKGYNLIIKPHPHLLAQVKTEQLMWKYEERRNVLFLKQFPPIYPLLNVVDIYIGDMSSIGYDFLAFDRPLFFLNQNERDAKRDPGLYLYRCGIEIKPDSYSKIYEIMNYYLPTEADDFSKIRKEVYEYAFGAEKNWDVLRQDILNSY